MLCKIIMQESQTPMQPAGERLASIETLLQTVVTDLKEIKADLKNKASTAELQVVHDRIDKFKQEVNALETEVDDIGKDVATLKASRKSDFWWLTAIAGSVSFLISIAAILIAAFIQKG